MALSNFQTVIVVLTIALMGLAPVICGSLGQKSIRQEILETANSGVEELNLSNRGLTSLPPEIGQLVQLKKLRLDTLCSRE